MKPGRGWTLTLMRVEGYGMESYLWPCKGGTWRDCAVAAAMLAELLLIWGSGYALIWLWR